MKSTFKRILISCSIIPSLTYAAFCPTNFNQIQTGDSIERVISVCGKPDKQTESTQENPNVPQQWDYFIPQSNHVNTVGGAQGILKTSLTFDKDGRLINISVNNMGVAASTFCGTTVKVGDTREQVKAACGTPSFLMKQNAVAPGSSGPPPDIKMTIMEYNSANPPAKLIFENGRLSGP